MKVEFQQTMRDSQYEGKTESVMIEIIDVGKQYRFWKQ